MTDDPFIDQEFPQATGLVYLNHAAVAPWPARAARAAREFADENVRLGASRYDAWLVREQELREQLCRLVNAPSVDDIALLKNTSEAISIVACGIDWRWGDNVVSTDEEFRSNRIPWEAQRKWGVSLREVPVRGADPEAGLMAACDERTRVLTVSSVQYGSGLRLDLARLGAFCREHGILFCVDAIQSLGAVRMDVRSISADFVMADAHKWMLGPEGIAVFYCRAEPRAALELRQYGWHMTHNAGDLDAKDWRPCPTAARFECGTLNRLGMAALSASLALLEEYGLARVERRLAELCAYLFDGLREIRGLEILTPADPLRRAGIVTFRVPGDDPQRLQRKLVEQQVICACRAGGVRLSPHFYQDRQQIDKALELIDTII
ncbi:MAG: aminotransferase class V-fold PLP-dependent enzyme [Gammaproteobacteria bacterium]|nr:aminotransferase class V-fold PLP-dependent enzyme [Gammaproteobacteria bacterium]